MGGYVAGEEAFILGLDLGDATSSLAVFDMHRGEAEVVDVSGGYGKPTVPTVMQYVVQTREWVVGEYAVLNAGAPGTVLVGGLLSRLGKREYIDIDGRPTPLCAVLGIFIKELAGYVKNINPSAEVVGIVACIPAYISEEAKAELLQAFSKAGLERELIGFVPENECVLYACSRRKSFAAKIGKRILMLDMGAKELRGALMEVRSFEEASLVLCSASSLFEGDIGTNSVNALVDSMMLKLYSEQQEYTAQGNVSSESIQRQLQIFAHQHRDMLWGKAIAQKPVRLYFNFAYPAFVKSVSKEDVRALVHDTSLRMQHFIARLLRNDTAKAGQGVDIVVMYGGGFEMGWARELVQAEFKSSEIIAFKNSKTIAAEGAAVAAAIRLGILPQLSIEIEDMNRLTFDIGIMVRSGNNRERFMPLVEQNSFWWQKRRTCYIILGGAVGRAPIEIALLQRDTRGEILPMAILSLDGLPPRPPGTTRISLDISFPSFNRVQCCIKDLGFGEIFPASDAEAENVFDVN